ncbi:MAG: hypothetical protein ACK4V6_10265 [Microthrixaceae bacterium]
MSDDLEPTDMSDDTESGADGAPADADPTDADQTDAVASDDERESVLVEETELEDGQLAYDCTAWAGETRGMLASLLSTAGIAHVWQGTVVTVREEDEHVVDDLIDDVLASARPALDPSAAKLVYEVSAWPVSLQTELVDALTASDVAYEWDEQGDLVVREDDEELVAQVLDELPDPDEEQVSSDDGVAVHELFDSVFMAADRLARNGADAHGTVQLVDAADVLGRLALPFGFEPPQWRALVSQVVALSDAIEPGDADGSGEAPEAVGDAEIASMAASVRELLRQYI